MVDAIGHMTLIMANDKLEEQLPKLLPGITGLYKKHTEHYLITQVKLLLSCNNNVKRVNIFARILNVHGLTICTLKQMLCILTVKTQAEFSIFWGWFTFCVLSLLLIATRNLSLQRKKIAKIIF